MLLLLFVVSIYARVDTIAESLSIRIRQVTKDSLIDRFCLHF